MRDHAKYILSTYVPVPVLGPGGTAMNKTEKNGADILVGSQAINSINKENVSYAQQWQALWSKYTAGKEEVKCWRRGDILERGNSALTEQVTFEQRPEGRRGRREGAARILRKEGSSRCKGPEVGASLA